MITLLPAQIVALLTLAKPIVGEEITVIVVVANVEDVLTQPPALVPLRVYTVVVNGFTVKLVPEIELGNNVYVLAPLGIITTLAPAQTELSLTEAILIVGVTSMVMVRIKFVDELLKHPVLLVPLIV